MFLIKITERWVRHQETTNKYNRIISYQICKNFWYTCVHVAEIPDNEYQARSKLQEYS